jgi:hypothetical protein
VVKAQPVRRPKTGIKVAISDAQLQALLIGLRWWRMGAQATIRVA